MLHKNQSESYYQERLRQARWSFNLAFIATSFSVGIIGLGVMLIYFGNTSAGKITAVAGLTSGTISGGWLWLSKDANDRLDKAASGK